MNVSKESSFSAKNFILDSIVLIPTPQLNLVEFKKMFMYDKLYTAFANVDSWLRNSFTSLDNYLRNHFDKSE